MRLTVLDAETLGSDVSMDVFASLGELTVHANTAPDEIVEHIGNAHVVLLNKIRLDKAVLEKAPCLQLICIAATGYDNIDVAYCREKGIAVCNVVGYSTQSVAQVTISMALSLITHLAEYNRFVCSGDYTASGCFNSLEPVFHEIAGKTWGIVGYGNIGRQVGKVAQALGCRVIVYKRTPVEDAECVDFETICRESDILSVHTPLNDGTRNLLDEKHIAMLKKDAIVINVARGAVCDEKALAEAVLKGNIGALGVDVYTKEPFPIDHPYQKILHLPNVCLTPHMAWGGHETRVRLLNEMAENVRSFYAGNRRCRVD